MPNEITTIRRSLVPTTFGEAMDFARMLAKSDMVPAQYRNKPENILLAIQWGMEVGLGPLQAVQSVAVISGKPSVFGDALLALVRGSPACEDVVESFQGEGDSLTAICIAQRRGAASVEARFSVADAKKAGLWNKQGPWQQYPRRMLQMRARGFALRDAFPDLLRGVITREEAEDYPVDVSKPREPIDVTPPRSTQKAHPLPQSSGEIIDNETGEVLDAEAVKTQARDIARQGWNALRGHLDSLTDASYDILRPLIGRKDDPGELRQIARDADARSRESFEEDFGLSPDPEAGTSHTHSPADAPATTTEPGKDALDGSGQLHAAPRQTAPAGDTDIPDLLGGQARPAVGRCRVRLADRPNTDDWEAWRMAMWAMIEAGDDRAAIRRDNRDNLTIFEQVDAMAHNRLVRALEGSRG